MHVDPRRLGDRRRQKIEYADVAGQVVGAEIDEDGGAGAAGGSRCVAIATRQKRRVERSPRSAAICATRARGHR